MNIWKNGALIFLIGALVACGGSGGSSGSKTADDGNKPTNPANPGSEPTNPSPADPDEPKPTVPEATAKVIDGYLENALVCLDENNNYRCDSSESAERTNAQGDFKLEKFTGKVVLAEIRANETKDNGELVSVGYVLRGVAEQGKHITPFSTLMLALQEAGAKPEAVDADLRDKLKLPADTDLTMDYIAADNKTMQRLAVMTVAMIQKINQQALALDEVSPQDDQGVIEFISWHQLSLEALASGANILVGNPDMTTTELVAAWQKDSNVALSAARIEQVKKDGEFNNLDADGDGIANVIDNCPAVASQDQTDTDSDGQGDVCDADDDNDSKSDDLDNCPLIANSDQLDTDGDGSGDACDSDKDNDSKLNDVDNCPIMANPGQEDLDNDGMGDVCDTDKDNDGVLNDLDNCPVNANADQKDFDSDGMGDVCDADADGDNVDDSIDNCLLKPNPGQEDLDGDGYGSACDDQEVTEFTKLSVTGAVLAGDATDYACVTQNMIDGKAVDINDRNTWMLLIPANATWKDLGSYVPAGKNDTDLFWGYTWTFPGRTFEESFQEANGLTSAYNDSSDVEAYVELLNVMKYCGFNDWTVPSILQMQQLNTKKVAADSDVKSLDRSVFKNFVAFETQVTNRTDRWGDPINAGYYPYLVNPYFWTSDRTNDRYGDPSTSVGDYKKYLHATAAANESIFIDTPGGQPYFALRAVRQNRFTKLAADKTELTADASDWACVRDNDAGGRRHWLNTQGNAFDVKYDDIDSRVEQFNTANTCGFADWRLPTADEVRTLKPVHSDAFFKIGQLADYINYNKYYYDYVWLNDKRAISLRKQYEYISRPGNSDKSHLLLVRDDIASGLALDAKVTEAETKSADIAQLKSDFDSNEVDDTLATDVSTLANEFAKFDNLAKLITNRQKAVTEFEPLVIAARTQFNALYVGQQTADRLADVLALEADVPVLKAALKADAEALKTWLDELYVVLDGLSPISDEDKAQLLFKGIQSGSVLTQLYAALGSDYDVIAAQVATINTTRTTEFTDLGVVVKLNHGYQKIAKDGSVAGTLAVVGDDWRCVQQQTTVDDFTQTYTWTLPVTEDRNLNYSDAHARRTALNTAVLCGIDAAADSAVNISVDANDKDGWAIPNYSQLDLIKTEDFNDGSTDYKTLDRSVFATHEASLAAHTYYWAEDKSTSSYYVDVLRFANSGDNPADSDAREIKNDVRANADNKANLMLLHSQLTYSRTDETCGSERVHYQGKCYRRVDDNKSWNDALAYCVANGGSLIGANGDNHNLRLGVALGLISGNRYWTREEGSSSWAYALEYENGKWQRDSSSRNRTDNFPFVCVEPTPGNELTVPAAPTNPVVDDDADTFGWDEVSGFAGNDQYEYSLDAGLTWLAVTANPQPVGYAARSAGDVQVRVKATENSNAPGSALLAGSFTETDVVAPTNPQVDDTTDTFGWDDVAGFSGADKYEYSMDGGSTWQAATANPQRISIKDISTGDVQVRVKANGSVNKAGAILSSDADFTAQVGPVCSGGNYAAEVKGRCYLRFDSGKKRNDALAHCESLGADMVSRNNPDLSDIGTALFLDTSQDYGLKEFWGSSTNYVYRLQYRSGSWRADNGDGRPFYNYPFICVK